MTMGDEVQFCSVCSEPISGQPLVELTADWGPIGAEAQTICSPDCFAQIMEQWREFVDDTMRKVREP